MPERVVALDRGDWDEKTRLEPDLAKNRSSMEEIVPLTVIERDRQERTRRPMCCSPSRHTFDKWRTHEMVAKEADKPPQFVDRNGNFRDRDKSSVSLPARSDEM